MPAAAESINLDALRLMVMDAFSAGHGDKVRAFLAAEKVDRVTRLTPEAQVKLAAQIRSWGVS